VPARGHGETDIRAGGPADADCLLAMFDDAVAWLSGRGQGGQWGTQPWSQQPILTARVRQLAAEEELWLARIDHDPAGALILTEHSPAYVPPASEPELYVLLMITVRRHAGRGVGTALLAHARAQARQRDAGLLRVDCWAGAAGRLTGYYASQGFAPTVSFNLDGWPGQVLEQRVPPEPPEGLEAQGGH
jgi:GNAT superfamily N-acetyltransferase